LLIFEKLTIEIILIVTSPSKHILRRCCTDLSPRYLKTPSDVIFTPDSRTNTDVKKKLNIFSANCNSCVQSINQSIKQSAN